jgi:uroporphyrinogen-III synthase
MATNELLKRPLNSLSGGAKSPGRKLGEEALQMGRESRGLKVVRRVQVQNVVITRSKKGNMELGKRLRRLGFKPIAVDTISLLPPKDWSLVDEALKELHSYDWLVFTSVTGVEFFGLRMKKLSLQVPWEGRPSVAAIGESTARALSKLGISVSFTPSRYLTQKLAAELPRTPGKRVLSLRAVVSDPLMSERLRTRGFDVTELPIYRTEHAGGGVRRRLEDADLIVFASPSAVKGFSRKIAGTSGKLEKLRKIRVACIGPVTATAAREYGFKRIVMPESQTFDSLLREIVRLNRDAWK